ncbi:MAG: LacI family DNA-binding transcriptional regulator [Dermatophilaceae bacterium]
MSPTGPGETPNEVTIYDVAEAAGVSPSTVSRAFSRPGRVSWRTAERVRAVAEQMGYRTDSIGQPRLPARFHTIGVATSDITNPFFFSIVRGAESAASKAGYTLLLTDTQESGVIEQETLARALPIIDGMVIVTSRTSDTVLRSIAKQVPVVILNRHVPGLPCVVPDTARGMHRAVEHLAGLGHRRICYVSGPEASWADGVRWRAMGEAAHERGLALSRVGPFAPTVVGGATAASAVRDKEVTAVVTYNDVMAIGLSRALQASGLAVPRDLSIVGFDNTFASDLVSPSLTTVAAPLRSLGEAGVNTVVAITKGAKPATDRPHVLPTRLVVRESTGPPPGPGSA